MSMPFHLRTTLVALVLTGLAGCSSQKTAIYEHEHFDDSGTFSRNYPVTDKASCEAARRALLSQGYIITSNDPTMISGHKSFQQTGESHLEISFNVVCAVDGGTEHHSTMFANALQDRYALKKVNNSASLGVGVLGSVSMPIGSSDDSMVKVASETVSSPQFYERYFTLVEVFLPKEVKKTARIPEKPKADLGVPEPAPVDVDAAPAPRTLAPVPAAPEPAPVPASEAVVEPAGSQPIMPPAAAEPIIPIEVQPVPDTAPPAAAQPASDASAPGAVQPSAPASTEPAPAQ